MVAVGPTYSPSEDRLVRLAFQNLTGTNLAQGNRYDMCNTTFAVTGNATAGRNVFNDLNKLASRYADSSRILGEFLFPIIFAGGYISVVVKHIIQTRGV
jgi:hypothetical protein